MPGLLNPYRFVSAAPVFVGAAHILVVGVGPEDINMPGSPQAGDLAVVHNLGNSSLSVDSAGAGAWTAFSSVNGVDGAYKFLESGDLGNPVEVQYSTSTIRVPGLCIYRGVAAVSVKYNNAGQYSGFTKLAPHAAVLSLLSADSASPLTTTVQSGYAERLNEEEGPNVGIYRTVAVSDLLSGYVDNDDVGWTLSAGGYGHGVLELT